MNTDIKEILFTQEQIASKVSELADRITEDYKGKNPLLICVLKGAIVFMSDLIRKIQVPLEIDFMSVSSYGEDVKSSGVVKIVKDLDISITGRDMIVVEDIFDTGLTLDYLIRTLEERKPKSIEICTLLLKNKENTQSQRKSELKYVGFECPDEFVVGYGLDYAEIYRNLPYIGILDEKVYMH